jgi:hypothetical protein
MAVRREAGGRRNGGTTNVAARLLAVLFLLSSSSFFLTVPAQEKPLPDAAAFFTAARENIARSGRVQNQFAYKERRTQIHMNPFGRMGTGGAIVYEYTPKPGGPGFTRRVLERDGKPVHNGEVEEVGGRRRARAQSPSAIQDASAALDFTMNRRVMVGGRPAILVTFAPKPDAKPVTREGRLAQAFSGTIWVDEATEEVTRVEATAIDSITYGYGLLARLNEGTVITLVRQHIDGGIWLPTSISFQGEGRALLVRKLNIDFGIEWFDYRRLSLSDQ